MMKKFNRFLGIVLATAVCLTSSISCFAHTGSTATGNIPAADQVLYSVRGQNAPATLLNELDSLDVHVDADTQLKVVPMQTSAFDATGSLTTTTLEPTALMITNENGSTVTTDVLFAFDSNGDFESILPVENGAVSPMAGGGAYLPSDGSNLIRATAVYNKVYEDDDSWGIYPYYQPVSMYFIYYANGVDNLTYAAVYYQTDGFEYTYPGFVDISNNETYLYEISRVVSNPASNTIYDRSSPYRTDRALWISSGAPWVGHFFSFNLTINGRAIDGTVRIFDND